MKKRQIIIGISLVLILVIFIVILVIIFNKKASTETTNDVENHYAVNSVKDSSNIEETTIMTVDGIVYDNINYLTYEQLADKEDMINLLKSKTSDDAIIHGNVINIDILEKSKIETIFTEVTYEDNSKIQYVLTYDNDITHSFMRCVSLDEYEYYMSGANLG